MGEGGEQGKSTGREGGKPSLSDQFEEIFSNMTEARLGSAGERGPGVIRRASEQRVVQIANHEFGWLNSMTVTARELLEDRRPLDREDVQRLPEVVMQVVRERISPTENPVDENDPLIKKLLEGRQPTRDQVVPRVVPHHFNSPEGRLIHKLEDLSYAFRAASLLVSTGRATSEEGFQELKGIVLNKAREIFSSQPKTT